MIMDSRRLCWLTRWIHEIWIEEGGPLFVVICKTQAGYEQVKSREAEACKHLTYLTFSTAMYQNAY